MVVLFFVFLGIGCCCSKKLTRNNQVQQNFNLDDVNHPYQNSNSTESNRNQQYNISVIDVNSTYTSDYLNVKPKKTEIDMFDDRLPSYEEAFNQIQKESNNQQEGNNSTNRAANS